MNNFEYKGQRPSHLGDKATSPWTDILHLNQDQYRASCYFNGPGIGCHSHGLNISGLLIYRLKNESAAH